MVFHEARYYQLHPESRTLLSLDYHRATWHAKENFEFKHVWPAMGFGVQPSLSVLFICSHLPVVLLSRIRINSPAKSPKILHQLMYIASTRTKWYSLHISNRPSDIMNFKVGRLVRPAHFAAPFQFAGLAPRTSTCRPY